MIKRLNLTSAEIRFAVAWGVSWMLANEAPLLPVPRDVRGLLILTCVNVAVVWVLLRTGVPAAITRMRGNPETARQAGPLLAFSGCACVISIGFFATFAFTHPQALATASPFALRVFGLCSFGFGLALASVRAALAIRRDLGPGGAP